MKVRHLEIQNFRNISFAEISPSENVNVIYGENAQGKTNLLESLWLFTGCKSFRSHRDKEMVKFNESFSKNSMDFYAFGREQTAALWIDQKRNAMKNGVHLKAPAELIGSFYAVLFVPNHLSLIKEGPQFRRRFLDTALCEIHPPYAKALAKYNRTLVQRNALLKDIRFCPDLLDTLDVWDENLASIGAFILAERVLYTEKLSLKANEIYHGLSGEKETLEVTYQNNAKAYSKDIKENQEILLKLLKEHRHEDLENHITVTGPHRDDLKITIDKLSARNYGSQGQQRSAALSLKLAEADIIEEVTGEAPVILLDDVLSELDVTRQDYILNHIQNRQVFLTCCDPSNVLRLCGGKSFLLKNGEIQKGD